MWLLGLFEYGADLQSLDGKAMFELPLTEVADVQGGKEDAIMEFHVDDGTISMTEDALCSVTFVIPEGNSEFPGAALPGQHIQFSYATRAGFHTSHACTACTMRLPDQAPPCGLANSMMIA